MATVHTSEMHSQNRHDRHTDSRFRLLEGIDRYTDSRLRLIEDSEDKSSRCNRTLKVLRLKVLE
jgi:t-SNARE complex subunit (syntaxin)